MPNPNQRISEYVLVEKIGGGTFGEVWKARHHVWSDQLVAIKIPTDGQYVRNLQREGAAIHGLVHPNIVRAMGFDPYADPAYLTMEYVPGTSLRPLIKSRALNIDQSIAVMRQVLAGLGYDPHPKGPKVARRRLKTVFRASRKAFRQRGCFSQGAGVRPPAPHPADISPHFPPAPPADPRPAPARQLPALQTADRGGRQFLHAL